MSKSKVRLAVVGLGMASKPHLEALKELSGEIEVSGLYNRSAARAETAAQTYGYPVFDRLEQVATDEATDGVIIATPPDQRVDLVEMLARSGKHILTEKPVERTSEAAAEIVGLCERHGVTLGVVFQHRFRAGAERMARAVRDRELGEIACVRATVPWWRPQSYYDEPGRGTYARDGGGVLISQAIHMLDLMLSLTGPVERVQAMTATTRLHRMEAEDFAVGGLQFASGAVGSVTATTATFPGETESLVIDGSLASAALVGGKATLRWQDGKTETVGEVSGTGGGADPMAFPCDWHRDLIADFCNAVRTGAAPRITGRQALDVHALIDGFVASARQAKSVEISAPGSG